VKPNPTAAAAKTMVETFINRLPGLRFSLLPEEAISER
jgi:hypothetical protein